MLKIFVVVYCLIFSINSWATSSGSSEELEAARLYQKYILDFNSENKKIEVIADIDNIAVPGYDGVILNSDGSPVANISIKTVQNIWTVRNRLSEAIHKIKIFSNPQEWFNRLSLEQQWIDETMDVFGVETDSLRPSVVIIDLKNEPASLQYTDEQIVNDFKDRLSKDNVIDEIVVFAQKKIYRVYRSEENLITELRPIKLECRRLFF